MKYRDLTIIPVGTNQSMVIACDMSAGIGEAVHDLLKVPYTMVGAYAARVVLIELLAFGATPILLTNLVGNHFETVGQAVLQGIREEIALAKLFNVEINGSSEENMVPTSTSVGVTGMGIINSTEYSMSTIGAGDCIYCVGKPLVGQAVIDELESIVTYDDIYALQKIDFVKEIIPVGSQGIREECFSLTKATKKCSHETLLFNEALSDTFLSTSAGPATCVLVVVPHKNKNNFLKFFPNAYYIATVK